MPDCLQNHAKFDYFLSVVSFGSVLEQVGVSLAPLLAPLPLGNVVIVLPNFGSYVAIKSAVRMLKKSAVYFHIYSFKLPQKRMRKEG
jgi:hypothetical protein